MGRVLLPKDTATKRLLAQLPHEIAAIKAEREAEAEEKRQQFLAEIEAKAKIRARIAKLQSELVQLRELT